MHLKSSPRAIGGARRAEAPWTIGEVAARSGVAASALRFYEQQGLIAATRTGGNQRLYPRHVLRRIGFIRAAQALGVPLAEVRAALATLPDARTPTKADWQRLARGWMPLLDARIAALERLRRKLDGCIGCGCLSMRSCALYNPQDVAAASGAGARELRGGAADAPLQSMRTTTLPLARPLSR